MDFKQLKGLTDIYAAVYDQDLREQILSVEEDFEFIDDLSDNDLDQIMESILEEGEVSLTECVNAFDGALLQEQTILNERRLSPREMGERRARTKSQDQKAEKSASQARQSGEKYEASERRKRRVERLKGAVGRAKTLGAGAVSAVAGGAAELGRKAKAGAEKLGGKLKSAKEKIKGFVGRVGRAAKAAKSELTGETSKAKRSEYDAKKSARETSARSSQAGAFNKPPRGQENRGKGVGTKEKVSSGSAPSSPMPSSGSFSGSERRKAAAMKLAKAVTGKTAKGIRFSGSQAGQAAPERASTGIKEKRAKFAQKLGLTNEQYDILINLLISEGYTNNYEDAMYMFESLDDTEIENLAESYLTEQTYDAYDVIVEYLCTEGYADTAEDAKVIMVNMSEEWRDIILDENNE